MEMIDSPGAFAPLEEWEAHLERVLELAKERPDDETLKFLIDEARATIKELEAGE